MADGDAVLWLPSTDGRPLASSAIIEEAPENGAVVALRPWRTSALSAAVAEWIDLLCRCLDTTVLRPGLFVGDDLAFWATAMRFAGALVARQSVLPDLERADGAARGVWRPVLLGRDAVAQARLAGAMPDACRAMAGEGSAPEVPATAVLVAFLDRMVDALARSAASPAAASAQARPRATKPAAAPPAAVDDRWLASLAGPSPELAAAAEELAALEQRLGDWRRPIAVTAASPFRLCFRLEEPDAGDADGAPDEPVAEATGAWLVRYLLQGIRDPSLLVPLPDAWAARGKTAAALKAPGFEMREFLLLSLAQAARLCPPVEASLRRGLPAGHETDAAGAVDFLCHHAPALEQAGVAVMLPAWWTRKGSKLRLTAKPKVRAPKMQGGSGLTLEEIVHVDWQVALGEQGLSRSELATLARLKAPLVRVRGQWVLLDAAAIAEARALLAKRGQAVSAREAIRLALGGPESDGVAADGATASGWIEDLLDRLRGRTPVEALAPPADFTGVLRPYQSRGFAWLGFLRRWGLGACLADDMGLGKTVQALALIQREKELAARKRTVLLVCPTSVISNWQHEAARFTPGLSVLVHHGGERAKGAALRRACRKHDLVITSYALLQRDVDAIKAVPWTGLILDEAQNIKNPESKQAKAARSLPATYRIALTGTPVENNVGDLWSIMEFLNPGLLGSQSAFKREFFVPIQTGRDGAAIERLRSLTGPFVLRRLKSDKSIIADLPEKLEMKVYCTLSREQASLYAAVAEDSLRQIEESEGIGRRGIVLATLSKLKQVCNHPAQFLGDNSAIPDRSGKLARLVEMMEEVLAVGDRALVFTQFAEMGEIIKTHLQDTFGREVPFLHGGVPKAKRDKLVERFQNGDGPSVFVLSLKAGGTGLNLTAANHVFHYDRWWNPAVEDQATDRAFRIGQTRRVEAHKFLCAGTLEDKIDEMIERKKAIAGAIVGTGEAWLTELSTADLRELLTLRTEAHAA
jgi:superfamily II DNA or RNA helicase